MKNKINNIKLHIKSIRDLDNGTCFAEGSIKSCEVISIDNEEVVFSMPSKLIRKGQRLHIDLNFVESEFNKIDFSVKATVIEKEKDTEDPNYSCMQAKITQYNQEIWQKIQKLFEERQKKMQDLFLQLKGY